MIQQFANSIYSGNTNNGAFYNIPPQFSQQQMFGNQSFASQIPSGSVVGRILKPQEIVDYATIIMGAYPPHAIASEPFISFKLLVRDPAANGYVNGNAAVRIAQIESNLTPIIGKGVLIRETEYNVCSDGYWLISLPVPRSQISIAIQNLVDVVLFLNRTFGFKEQPAVEINVSGKCGFNDVEKCICGLVIPDMYQQCVIQPNDSPYRVGKMIRINEQYVLFRTKWDLSRGGNSRSMQSDIMLLGQLISSIYH